MRSQQNGAKSGGGAEAGRISPAQASGRFVPVLNLASHECQNNPALKPSMSQQPAAVIRPDGRNQKVPAKLPDAFTLVELLVVMVILGILGALLYPVIGKATDQARLTQCTNNLRQIGVALLSYSNDHDGRFPNYWNDPGATPPGDGKLWYVEMADYGLTGKSYVCPSATYRNSERIPGLPYGDTSYGLSTTVSLAKLVGISPLSERFLAGEGNQLASWKSAGAALQYSAAINNGPTPDSDDTDDATGNAGWIRYRHDHRANMLYADGHVGTISKADVQKYVTSGQWERHWQGAD